MRGTRPILLVEDDRVDVLSVQRAFRELKIVNPLQVVGNGEEGLDYLRDENNPKPCLILLDLNMPRMNGVEFLKTIKSDEHLRGLPVIVLTSSKGDQEMLESYQYGVAGYIVKPADYLQFVEVVRVIDLYWTISEIPGNRR
ncbi:MAG: response regulator [Desulfomonile tiedjei]|nr:response regulator [Desulfomonile tiedjei]